MWSLSVWNCYLIRVKFCSGTQIDIYSIYGLVCWYCKLNVRTAEQSHGFFMDETSKGNSRDQDSDVASLSKDMSISKTFVPQGRRSRISWWAKVKDRGRVLPVNKLLSTEMWGVKKLELRRWTVINTRRRRFAVCNYFGRSALSTNAVT